MMDLTNVLILGGNLFLQNMSNGKDVEIEDVVKFRADQRRDRMGRFAPEGDGGNGGITLTEDNSGVFWGFHSDVAYSDKQELKSRVADKLATQLIESGVTHEDFKNAFIDMKRQSSLMAMNEYPDERKARDIKTIDSQLAELSNSLDSWDGEKPVKNISVIYKDGNGNIYAEKISNLLGREIQELGYTDLTVNQAQSLIDLTNAKYPVQSHLAFSPEGRDIMAKGVTSDLVHTWAISSNNNHIVSHAIQETAKETFNLSDTAEWASGVPTGFAQNVKDFRTNNQKILTSFVNAQYRATQDYFAQKGISKVVLYRGVDFRGAPGRATREPAGSGGVELRPLSSWSTDLNTTLRFGDNISGSILRKTFDVKDIVSTPFTGVGCLNEYEMVVKGGVRFVDYNETATVGETGSFD